jgi:lysophospholipase L1-like esterase
MKTKSPSHDTLETVRAHFARKEPVRWLFCGDSITHGLKHTRGRRDYTQHFAERVRGELGRRRDVVLNVAASGETTRELLEDFKWRVEESRPDVVFLMIGMNDCAKSRSMQVWQFSSNLKEFCRRVQALGAAVVLQTSPPVVQGLAPEREALFPAFMDVVRSVAHSNSAALVDHHDFWRNHPGKHILWMADAYHPGAYGHLAVAHCLFHALGIFCGSSDTCRLP